MINKWLPVFILTLSSFLPPRIVEIRVIHSYFMGPFCTVVGPWYVALLLVTVPKHMNL